MGLPLPPTLVAMALGILMDAPGRQALQVRLPKELWDPLSEPMNLPNIPWVRFRT